MFALDVCMLLLHISVALVMWFVSPIHFVFHQFTSFGSPCGRNDKRRVYYSF